MSSGSVASRRAWSARILDAVGDSGEDGPRVAAFRSVVLAHAFAQSCLFVAMMRSESSAWVVGVASGVAATQLACLVVSFHGTLSRFAAPVAFLTVLWQLVWFFPSNSNHLLLSTWSLFLLALLDTRDHESASLQLRALRWSTVIVLFYTGVQKLLYGAYFQGDFLLYTLHASDEFATVFRFLLPVEEFERIRAIDLRVEGAGPFRTRAPLFLLASNLVWVAELLLPVALVYRRTRVAAVWISLAFVVSIQTGARELLFALLFGNLVLLLHPDPWVPRLRWVVIALYLYAVGMALGWVPGTELLRPTGVEGVAHI